MDLLTLREASQELGVAHATLRAQVHRGKLAALKVGRDWLVTRDELERYRLVSRHHQPRNLAKPAMQAEDGGD